MIKQAMEYQKNIDNELLTRQQQKSLFLWLGQVAEVLREMGLDMRKALIAPIIPTKNSVKVMVFTPIMVSMYGKTSTTELLKKAEIDSICDVMRSMFGDLKIELPPFPSSEKKQNDEPKIYRNKS